MFGAGGSARAPAEGPAGASGTVAAATSSRAAPPRARPATVLREPVRGGQQITADGDLVVLSAVSAGAELAAAAVHPVYGILRGRAAPGSRATRRP